MDIKLQNAQSEIRVSKRKKKAMLNDKAFIEQVTERVYQLMLVDLRHEQERRGGKK